MVIIMHNKRFRLNDFTDLTEKLQRTKNTLNLDSDVCLSDDDEMDYIKIDRSNITIDGKGHTIDAKGRTGIFEIDANNVTLKNMVFKNAKSCDGGAIVNRTGRLNITGCRFTDNIADFEGGAILNLADLKIENTGFENNSCTLNGGAVNNKGVLKAFGCEFKGNSTDNLGGAIINWKRTFLKDCIFESNHARRDGGAVNNQKGQFKILNCKFAKNTSRQNAGAVMNLDELDVYGSEFVENTSEQCGALFNSFELRVFDCRFNSNQAEDNGGAINNHNDAIALVYGCEFKKNSAEDGAAINNYGYLKIGNSRLGENKAGYQGGVLRAQKGGYLWIEESNEFAENDALCYSAYAPDFIANYCDVNSCFYNYFCVPLNR